MSSMSGKKDYEGYTGRRMRNWPANGRYTKKRTHRAERRAGIRQLKQDFGMR